MPNAASGRFSAGESPTSPSPDYPRTSALRRERSAHTVGATEPRTMAHLEEVIRNAEDTTKTTEWLQHHIDDLVSRGWDSAR
jgi:hypothetical protein